MPRTIPRSPVERSAADYLPPDRKLSSLKAAAAGCKGCDLYLNATQTVFGEGPRRAAILMVGEQPGDREDLAGAPFVGPAGQLLDRALEEAQIDRSQVYVTNAVKHFKWEPRGKRRIHTKPNSLEIAACRPWLDAEMESVKPRVVVCLGATAAQSLLGKSFKVTQRRGEVLRDVFAGGAAQAEVVATVHPSSILRAPHEEARHLEMQRFVDDLKKVADVLRHGASPH